MTLDIADIVIVVTIVLLWLWCSSGLWWAMTVTNERQWFEKTLVRRIITVIVGPVSLFMIIFVAFRSGNKRIRGADS